MIVDIHYHLDERMEPLKRLVEQMDQHGIDKIVLMATMVDPIHVEGIAEKTSQLLRKMLIGPWNSLGLLFYEGLVTKDGKFKVLTTTYNIDQCPDNELVAKALKTYPDRFYAWYFFNPVLKGALANMRENIESGKWLGIKCHPFWHCFPIMKLDEIASYCLEKDMPIIIHLGGNKENGDFRYLPQKYPDLKVIYAHAGIPHYSKMWPYVKEKKNVVTGLRCRLNLMKLVGEENSMPVSMLRACCCKLSISQSLQICL